MSVNKSQERKADHPKTLNHSLDSKQKTMTLLQNNGGEKYDVEVEVKAGRKERKKKIRDARDKSEQNDSK